MYCRRCGSEVDDTSNYCRYCGALLRSDDLGTKRRKLQKETALYTTFSAFVIVFFVVSIIIIQNNPLLARQGGKDHTSQTSVDARGNGSSSDVIEAERKLGSAKVLEGDTILISTFVDVKGDTWTEEEKDYSRSALQEAVEWIEKEGRAYGKEINFIYDLSFESDLLYYQSIDFAVDSDSEDANQYKYYLHNKLWIQENLDVASIKEKYGTDSVGYLFFVKDAGTSYTYSHYMEDKNSNKEEMCTIYLKDSSYSDGCYENPATYAHEILHLYGALDLYDGACPENINEYVRDTYPYEIMLSTYYETLLPNEYGEVKEISPITAYMLYWIDDIEELIQFPEMKREEGACFSEMDYGGYYFEEIEEEVSEDSIY